MTEIPIPQDSGASGLQQTAPTELLTLEPERPFRGLSMAQTIEGLAASQSQRMGGVIGASIVAASYSQLTYELQEIKGELKITREELKQTLQEHSETKTKAAVLQERVDAIARNQHLRNLGIFVGTTLLTVGVDMLINNIKNFSWVVIVFGVLLISLSWFQKRGGAEK